jgi:hypothetical protein
LQPIADALASLPADNLIPEGEAVVADSRGLPDFGLLHTDLAAGRQDGLLYYAFDLLYLDGFDLRVAALVERKRLLAELLADASERILLAEHLEGRAPRSKSAPAPWVSKGSQGPRSDRRGAKQSRAFSAALHGTPRRRPDNRRSATRMRFDWTCPLSSRCCQECTPDKSP